MSYVFQPLLDMTNDKATQDGQATARRSDSLLNPGSGSSAPPKQPQDEALKTDTSSDLGSSSSGASGGTTAPRTSQGTGFVNPSAVVQANVSDASSGLTQSAIQKFQDASSGIDKDFQGYTSTLGSNTAALDKGTLDSAVGGDTAAQGKVSSRLSGADTSSLKAWTPASLSTPDVSTLGSGTSGIETYLGQQNPDSTPGENRLDAVLYRQSPNYQKDLSQIASAGTAYNNHLSDLKTQATDAYNKATGFLGTGAGSDAESIKASLGQRINDLLSNASTSANTYNQTQAQAAKDEAQRQALFGLKSDAIQTYLGAIDPKTGRKIDPNSAGYKALDGLSIDNYIHPGSETSADALSDADKKSILTIDQLLSNPAHQFAPSGASQTSFDSDGLKAAIQKILSGMPNAPDVTPNGNLSGVGAVIEGQNPTITIDKTVTTPDGNTAKIPVTVSPPLGETPPAILNDARTQNQIYGRTSEVTNYDGVKGATMPPSEIDTIPTDTRQKLDSYISQGFGPTLQQKDYGFWSSLPQNVQVWLSSIPYGSAADAQAKTAQPIPSAGQTTLQTMLSGASQGTQAPPSSILNFIEPSAPSAPLAPAPTIYDNWKPTIATPGLSGVAKYGAGVGGK